MDALDRGDNHDAATRLGRFLKEHPRDPRAEDAAYSRVIALERSGDTSGMKDAAQEYLRRYPVGFRHTEVDALSR
jgi:outer membrane protein assembly factor BamD (BamD/ComL family)